ncbi:MAG: ArgE/DapE family deacylase [Gemmatimonadetes bacterium]|nr:ArgE/DapE family deacylase [Gemmatimonadota bacterium]
MNSDLRAPIRQSVQSRHDEQIDFLAELVRVPTDNPPGDCRAHATRTLELLTKLGLEVERHEVPSEVTKDAGMKSVTNLVVRRRFGDGPTVALNAHGDAVPPGEGWSRNPYGAEIVEGQMYGRGVAVSKSDFATYTFALLALEEVSSSLSGTVELHFTYDEEIGGEIGPKRLLSQGISAPDYAIVAGFSYGVVTAHAGCLHLEVEICGKIAHAAMPDTGIDALEGANCVLSALYGHRKEYGTRRSKVSGIEIPTLVIGLIEGGVNTNVVPDRVRFRLDRRLIPEETAEAVESEIQQVISTAVSKMPGIKGSVRRLLLAHPLVPTPASERLAALLATHGSEVIGEEIQVHGVPLYTDARHYAEQGVPTVVYGAGPRDIIEAGAHGADERLDLNDLRKATEVIALTLADLLTGSY